MTFNGSTREEELERRLERLDQCGLILIEALQQLAKMGPEAEAIVDKALAQAAEVAA